MTYARISSRDRRVFLTGVRSFKPVIWLICARTSSAAAANSAAAADLAGSGAVRAGDFCANVPPLVTEITSKTHPTVRTETGVRTKSMVLQNTRFKSSFAEYAWRQFFLSEVAVPDP